jgi:5-methylcytosine-specific restriction endonuclease McrA
VKATSQVCWICGHLIDKTLPATDPMSFTVDHVIPLSRGGPARDLALLRAAHRRCNSRRGNQLGFGPLPVTSRRW